MANLRDRGYGNSMEGLQLKKAPERHTRKKTVAPGEASVSKGQKVSNTPVQDGTVVRLPSPEQIRSTPNYGAVPEYSPVYPTGLSPAQSTPLDFDFTDPKKKAEHVNHIAAYEQNEARKKQLVPAETGSSLSMDDLKKRIDELNEAIWDVYRKRDGEKFRPYDMGHRQVGGDNPSALHPAWMPYYDIDPELEAASHYAAYNWDVADLIDAMAWDLDLPDWQKALSEQELNKARAAGKSIFGDHNGEYWLSLMDKKRAGVDSDEETLARLVNEQRYLSNEYNTRLARYLQTYGG